MGPYFTIFSKQLPSPLYTLREKDQPFIPSPLDSLLEKDQPFNTTAAPQISHFSTSIPVKLFFNNICVEVATNTYSDLKNVIIARTGLTDFSLTYYVPTNNNRREPFSIIDDYSIVQTYHHYCTSTQTLLYVVISAPIPYIPTSNVVTPVNSNTPATSSRIVWKFFLFFHSIALLTINRGLLIHWRFQYIQTIIL